MVEIIVSGLTLAGVAALAVFYFRTTTTTGEVRDKINSVDGRITSIEKGSERTERAVREEIGKSREESERASRETRKELSVSVQSLAQSIREEIGQSASAQKNQLDSFAKQLASLTTSTENRMESVRKTVEDKLKSIQEDNHRQIEQMRQTVDEKLHTTLEKRLGESFKQVSDRLEQVHRGLGEMQTLATGVGDLKRVLTNIKARGTWGEVQLGMLLEQVLTPDQYEQNVKTKQNSNDHVEYAIKLPGREEGSSSTVWLPVDAKFPMEDYQVLVAAQDRADQEQVLTAGRQLETKIKNEAKSIRDKYIDPPTTTDFGVLFLPIEGLYAEVVRRPGLTDFLQREYRVVVAGPTTFAALLNSLQMGFKTLAIQKRSSEIWGILGAVKSEFGKFAEILERTQKQLQTASSTLESAATKSRTIEKKLKKVEEMPGGAPTPLLDAPDESVDGDEP